MFAPSGFSHFFQSAEKVRGAAVPHTSNVRTVRDRTFKTSVRVFTKDNPPDCLCDAGLTEFLYS